MIKCEPYPLVNGWVAYNMLKINEHGFNRLMLFMQKSDTDSFATFTDGLESDNPEFNHEEFIYDFSIRLLQLPLNRVPLKNISAHEILSFA
jgi:hypothetical protein